MDIFAEAGTDRLREKSQLLTGYLEFLLRQQAGLRYSIITPSESSRRGAQLSIRLSQGGRSICDRLTSQGVVGDWREPDTYRIAPVPLYNSFHDVYRFVQIFLQAIS